jgi:diacylglycerol kinase family enzyme
MPNDAIAGVDLIVDALNRNDIIPVGLGRVNGRYFCFHTGVGYDAMVVKRVEERASLKRYAGHPLFVAAALRTWARDYDRKHPHFSVAINDDVIPRAFFTIVLNTNPYTFLGNRPFDLVPGADLQHGLAVITFTSLQASHIIRSLGSALRGGGISPAPWLDIRSDIEQLTVTNDRPFPFQVDGDYLGETKSLDFQHVPDAMRLVRSFPTS